MATSRVERVGLDHLDATGNPFQSHFWAKAKRSSGWRSFAFRYTHGDSSVSSVILILVRRLMLGSRIAYIPFAPDPQLFRTDASILVREFATLVRPLLPKGTAFIRFDLPWQTVDSEEVAPVTGRFLRQCKESVQPEGTSRIDLTGGYDAVRLRYRQRARRNIRKSLTSSVRIERWTGDVRLFDRWYAIYLETAKRDGFSARSASYIKGIVTMMDQDVTPHLYLALSASTLLGGAVVLENETVALYLYGASLRIDGSSPSYLLQDHAIQEACARGKAVYDLYGISGPGNRGGHLEGLRLFKRAFGGSVCYRPQSFDFVYKPVIRFAYERAERIRYRIHRKRHPKRMSQQYSVSNEE